MLKKFGFFVAAALLVLFTAGAIWGARVDPKKSTPAPVERGDKLPDYLITKASGIFQTSIYSPYDTILGYTWYDNQHGCRIPRMNANDYQTPRGLHFTFMEMLEPPGSRYVTYAYWDAVSGWDSLPAPRITRGPDYGGYTGIDLIRPLAGYFKPIHSRAVVCYHTTEPVYPNPDEMSTMLSIEPNAPGDTSMWGGHYWYDVPDAAAGSDWHGMFPVCGVDSLNRIHVVMVEGGTMAGIDWGGYTRCEELPGDSLECCAPGKGCVRLAKETYYTDQDYEVAVFGYLGSEFQIVATSKVSNKVALLWLSMAESLTDSGQYQNRNDVFYVESSNGGDDWQLAGAMPPRINITRYQPEDRYRSFSEVSALYDFDDSLHVFWVGQGYDQALNQLYRDDVTLWHWSKATERYCGEDTLLHNLVSAADWEIYPAPGAWNRTITKIQSGIGIELSNYNNLYVQWTQFDDPEENPALWNAAENYLQGDIYISVSTDLGFTWQDPFNVTKSAVDHCTSGVCASDHWGSMAERVDTCVYMQWIYDLDAGGCVSYEGVATNNPVLFRAFPVDSIPIDTTARIIWNPENFVDPPMHAPLNGKDTVYLTIENVGAKTLNVNISTLAGWLSMDPTSGAVLPGGCPLKVELIATAGSQEEFLADSIRIQSNDEAGNENVYVRINVVFSDEYGQPEFVVISNPTYHLSVSNTGNLGHQVDTSGMYLYKLTDPLNFIFDASPAIGFIVPDVDDTLVGRYIFEEHYLQSAKPLEIDTIPGLKTKKASGEFWPIRIQVPPEDQYWPWWKGQLQEHVMYSADIGLRPNKNEQYMALLVLKLFHDEPPPWWPDLTPPASYPTTLLGMALDIDAPADSDSWNYPGYDEDLRMAFLQGYGTGYERYRFAIAQRDTCYTSPYLKCWPNPGTLAQRDEPYAMHLLRNDVFVYPQGGYRDDSLYTWMNSPGYSVYGDSSATDYNIVTTGAVISNHSLTDTFEVRYALLISDKVGPEKTDTLITSIQCGNTDRDKVVGLADVVFLIGYVLKGGDETWLYMSDADGNCNVGLADIVWLIGYLFQGGPPPKCSCSQLR
jgi:hypothetical protein